MLVSVMRQPEEVWASRVGAAWLSALVLWGGSFGIHAGVLLVLLAVLVCTTAHGVDWFLSELRGSR